MTIANNMGDRCGDRRMRRRYGDCQRNDGNCTLCSLVSCGRDCHGQNIGKFAWMRMASELSQPALAEKSGVDIRKIQRLEAGDIAPGNLSLRVAVALSDALEVDVRDLL